MTNVLNLMTGQSTLYTLSPVDAVIAAYAQNEKKNFNTWTYDQYANLVQVIASCKPGITVVTCGNQSCICPTGAEREYLKQDYEWTPADEIAAIERQNKVRRETVALLQD